MSAKCFNKRNGFSFIEVLVATAILAFLVVGVLTMTTAHIKTNSFAIHHTKAVQLAEESVERFLRMDFSLVQTFGTVTEAYGNIDNYPEFTRTTNSTMIDADNYRVTSTVRWRSQGVDSNPIILSIIRTL
jgi:prepilin-type N-terminal cleavage/methylation domain-containing protein